MMLFKPEYQDYFVVDNDHISDFTADEQCITIAEARKINPDILIGEYIHLQTMVPA
jgi:hypothetical protein